MRWKRKRTQARKQIKNSYNKERKKNGEKLYQNNEKIKTDTKYTKKYGKRQHRKSKNIGENWQERGNT